MSGQKVFLSVVIGCRRPMSGPRLTMKNAVALRQSQKSASVPMNEPQSRPIERLHPTLSREQVARRLDCSHIELCRLLREKRAPLPVRLDQITLWYEDEVEAAIEECQRVLSQRRKSASAKRSSTP